MYKLPLLVHIVTHVVSPSTACASLQALVACDSLARGLPEVVAAEQDRPKWLRSTRTATAGTVHPAPAGMSCFSVSVKGARQLSLTFHPRTRDVLNNGGFVEIFYDEARSRPVCLVTHAHFAGTEPIIVRAVVGCYVFVIYPHVRHVACGFVGLVLETPGQRRHGARSCQRDVCSKPVRWLGGCHWRG